MVLNDFKGIKLSALGMGCMRLPCNDNEIDILKTKEMVDFAIKNGVNYFDTAWGYHGGKSETVMGEILSEYPRESFYLASKFPGYDLNNINKVEEIFEKQLEKCRVDYFDFYLFHNVCEANIDAYLNPEFGIYKYLTEQKRKGRIRHLGFSVHGNIDTTKRFLEAYGNDMEFAQIQLNWLDVDLQNAKAKVTLLNSLNIPIWVMEPLRGGSLVNIAQKHSKMLNSLHPEWSIAEWSFRYLQSVPGVTVTLSGMSNFEQLKQNVEIFKTHTPLTPFDLNTLKNIAKEMISEKSLLCTSCRYCVTHCPKELDIPGLIEFYNEHNFSSGGFIAPMAIGAMAEEKRPSACIGCRSCEAVCPQNIKISEMMKDFTSKL